jgi:aminoglycoside 6'-N-acetyltransferase
MIKPMLQGDRVSLRPTCEDDVSAIVAILAEPGVAGWWGSNDAESVRADLPASFAIDVDDVVSGWLLFDEETTPGYRHVAFDIALATRIHGRGYGRQALRLAIRHFADLGHHRFTIDPAAHNARAIRCYASVGFKPVGVMREYERLGEGPWHDALLMDLLAHELTG